MRMEVGTLIFDQRGGAHAFAVETAIDHSNEFNEQDDELVGGLGAKALELMDHDSSPVERMGHSHRIESYFYL